MTPKQFRKYLDRDRGCVHCGATEAVSPNHRANRGMGGSRLRDVPSNIVVLCSWLNNAIEQDSGLALQAIDYGWKLRSYQVPHLSPVYDAREGVWYLLDDDYNRTPTKGPAEGII